MREFKSVCTDIVIAAVSEADLFSVSLDLIEVKAPFYRWKSTEGNTAMSFYIMLSQKTSNTFRKLSY